MSNFAKHSVIVPAPPSMRINIKSLHRTATMLRRYEAFGAFKMNLMLLATFILYARARWFSCCFRRCWWRWWRCCYWIVSMTLVFCVLYVHSTLHAFDSVRSLINLLVNCDSITIKRTMCKMAKIKSQKKSESSSSSSERHTVEKKEAICCFSHFCCTIRRARPQRVPNKYRNSRWTLTNVPLALDWIWLLFVHT